MYNNQESYLAATFDIRRTKSEDAAVGLPCLWRNGGVLCEFLEYLGERLSVFRSSRTAKYPCSITLSVQKYPGRIVAVMLLHEAATNSPKQVDVSLAPSPCPSRGNPDKKRKDLDRHLTRQHKQSSLGRKRYRLSS
jgi:hypothetical protein